MTLSNLLALHVYILASQKRKKFLSALARFDRFPTKQMLWSALNTRIGLQQRLSVLCRGHFSALLVQKLIIPLGGRFSRHVLRSAIAMISRTNIILAKDSILTCISTLEGHRTGVQSVAFHPSAPYLVTGSLDNTAKLWLLSEDDAPTFVSTLEGHTNSIFSVAFHPSEPYLVTGSFDKTAKLWLLTEKDTTCVFTLQGHKSVVLSVAFHPSAPYLATGSYDNTTKLWRLRENTATCIITLQGHRKSVTSVVFHPSAPYLLTGSDDGTAKL
jgi:WD40 repeat protein